MVLINERDGLQNYMRECEFRNWLKDKNKKVVGDYIARCLRVESNTLGLGINLDNAYKKDGGKSLLIMLNYSMKNGRDNVTPPGNLKFKEGSNIFVGMAALRSSVRKYIEFCNINPPT